MNINIRGKNIEITNALREYVEKRIGKLDKYFEGLDEAQVTLTVERDRHRIEATIPVNGMILRGEEETMDMYSSIDLVIDKLEKQIAKHKTRLSRKVKNGNLLDLVPKQNNGYAEELEPQVLRTKRFTIKPMPIDEAIMQMNLIGHNFYVFSNAETEEVNVVYKRKDGHYGLIEPEF